MAAWQYQTAMGERSLNAYEVYTAVRPDVRTVKGLPVNADRKWECDNRRAIIAMVAGVGVAGRDRARASAGMCKWRMS